MAESNTRSFTVTATNGMPAFMTGYVRNSATGAPIAGANVRIGGKNIITHSNGAYLGIAPTGSVSISVSANGYELTTLSNLIATAGRVLFKDISLLAVAVSSKAGDCDNSGGVTISEVQSAINMLMGLQPVLACVDASGDGAVSISEVQKAINVFLGVAN